MGHGTLAPNHRTGNRSVDSPTCTVTDDYRCRANMYTHFSLYIVEKQKRTNGKPCVGVRTSAKIISSKSSKIHCPPLHGKYEAHYAGYTKCHECKLWEMRFTRCAGRSVTWFRVTLLTVTLYNATFTEVDGYTKCFLYTYEGCALQVVQSKCYLYQGNSANRYIIAGTT